MKKTRIATLVLFLAIAAGRLVGQSYRTFQADFDEIRARTGLRLGPLTVLPVFHLSDVGYDSNVYYRDRQESAVSDYTARASLDVKAAWLIGNSIILSATEDPEYVYYLNEKDLRTFVNSYGFGSRLLLFRRLALSGGYRSESHLRRAYSEFDQQIKDMQKGFTAALFYETPRGTAVGFSGSSDDFSYENIGLAEPDASYSRALDRRERSAAFEFYYRVFSQSSLFCRVAASAYDFKDPEFAWRNARSYQAYVGIRFPVLGAARGTLALGYKKFVPRAEGRKEFSGLVADSDVAFRAGRVGLHLAYTRDNYFSYLETAYYYIEDRFRCGLTFYLLPFLRLEGTCQLGAWNYPDTQEVWFQGETYLISGRRDNNRVFSAGLAVRVAGSAGLSLSYNLYRRRSNAPGYDIDRNFVGAGLTYDF
jgi:hypothetical protein